MPLSFFFDDFKRGDAEFKYLAS